MVEYPRKDNLEMMNKLPINLAFLHLDIKLVERGLVLVRIHQLEAGRTLTEERQWLQGNIKTRLEILSLRIEVSFIFLTINPIIFLSFALN